MSPRALRRLASVLAIALVAGCGSAGRGTDGHYATPNSIGAHVGIGLSVPAPGRIPAPLDPSNVYAAERPGLLSPVVRGDPALVYVPNSKSNTVTSSRRERSRSPSSSQSERFLNTSLPPGICVRCM
jgi:hypothetical protein